MVVVRCLRAGGGFASTPASGVASGRGAGECDAMSTRFRGRWREAAAVPSQSLRQALREAAPSLEAEGGLQAH